MSKRIFIPIILVVLLCAVIGVSGCQKQEDLSGLPQTNPVVSPAETDHTEQPQAETQIQETQAAESEAETLSLQEKAMFPDVGVYVEPKAVYTPLEAYAIEHQDVLNVLSDIMYADIEVVKNNIDFRIDVTYIDMAFDKDGKTLDPNEKAYLYRYMLLYHWNEFINIHHLLEKIVGSPITVTFTYLSTNVVYAQNTFSDETTYMSEEDRNSYEWPSIFSENTQQYSDFLAKLYELLGGEE